MPIQCCLSPAYSGGATNTAPSARAELRTAAKSRVSSRLARARGVPPLLSQLPAPPRLSRPPRLPWRAVGGYPAWRTDCAHIWWTGSSRWCLGECPTLLPCPPRACVFEAAAAARLGCAVEAGVVWSLASLRRRASQTGERTRASLLAPDIAHRSSTPRWATSTAGTQGPELRCRSEPRYDGWYADCRST